MGKDARFGCMSMCFLFWDKVMGKQALPGCSEKSIFYQCPLECQPAFSWMNAVPWPLSCSRTCRAKDNRVEERTEAMLLCCKHKLSPKLAENHGFRASCVYSVLSALHLKLAH